METVKHKPTANLRSVKLYIRNQRTFRQYFEVKVIESAIVDNKLEKRVADQIETQSTTELVLFMSKYGVAQGEIAIAGQEMANHDHNAADFGWFGGFITSFIDEVIQ